MHILVPQLYIFPKMEDIVSLKTCEDYSSDNQKFVLVYSGRDASVVSRKHAKRCVAHMRHGVCCSAARGACVVSAAQRYIRRARVKRIGVLPHAVRRRLIRPY